MSPLAVIGAIAVLVWFWVNSLRAREQAVQQCAAACQQMNVQFLDQTVALCHLGLGKAGRGRIQIRRGYSFEFSTDGVNRHKGHTELLGSRVEYVQLDHPDGSTILDFDGLR